MNRFLISAICALGMSSIAMADSYPDGPVTLVAPYGAGGASDLAARSLAEVASPILGEPVTVVNMPGAGGMTGATNVVESEADGQTLLLARIAMVLTPAVNPDAPIAWDEYTFLGALETTPMILAVNAQSPYQSVAELLQAVEDDPSMIYAASGPTAIDGFTVQALLSDAGLDPLAAATLVPFQGGGALSTALLGGHVDFLAIAAGSLMPHIEAENLRPLMVYAPSRMAALPDVPTAAELGYELAGQIEGWSALYGPRDLPEDVVQRWNTAFEEIATSETWLDLADRRGSISTVGRENFPAYIEGQYQFYRDLAVQFGYIAE